MKKIAILILNMMAFSAVHAQQAVPVSGGSAKNGTGFFSFTLGQIVCSSDFEPAVSVNSVTASVIEGVQQPYTIDQLIIDGILPLDVEISLYPNPTARCVNVKSSDEELKINYKLYNVAGQMMQEGVMNGEMVLDTKDYPSGCYMLHLKDENKRENIYRIVKIR